MHPNQPTNQTFIFSAGAATTIPSDQYLIALLCLHISEKGGTTKKERACVVVDERARNPSNTHTYAQSVLLLYICVQGAAARLPRLIPMAVPGAIGVVLIGFLK
jgi:hypothetical protein